MSTRSFQLALTLVALTLVLIAVTCGADCAPGLLSVPAGGGSYAAAQYCVPIVPLGFIVDSTGGDSLPGCEHVHVLEGGEGDHGNYGLLEFPHCEIGPCAGGGGDLRCQLTEGYYCWTSLGDAYRTAPGLHTGVVRAAMEARFARDTDQREGICFSDYHGNGSRVVVAPVGTALGTGGRVFRVRGFATFFLRDIPRDGGHDRLSAEYVEKVVLGGGGPAR